MLRLVVRAVLVAVLVAALVEGGTGGVVLGIGGSIALLVVMVRDGLRSRSVFQRVRRRLQHVQPWTVPVVIDGVEEWDPYADDRVTGLWNGCRVQIAATTTGALIVAPLNRWPAALTAERRGDPGGVVTGDETFDQVVRVVGDDVLWRCTLVPELRRQLVAVCGHARATVRDRMLEIVIEDADVENLEAVLDLAAALAATLPAPHAEPMARVFELAMAEPVSGVRAEHYRWLVEHGWNTPQVHRVAAKDADASISAWGASQLAPADGAFR